MPPSRTHFRSLLALSLTLHLGSAASAQAQPGTFATTWSQEAVEGVAASLESPELRSLRQYEQELFGVGPMERPRSYDPDCVYGTPDALNSDMPPAALERAGESVDLSFLHDLQLPTIPVRWDSRVIDYLFFFKNDSRGRDLMGAWLKRMERYGPMIRRVLAEHALPKDLEIVAMVESGYDPVARSAMNAHGLWQFVKVTGDFYGLRIDSWVDERLDPIASTHAAARYLRDLYDRFESWELSFAGYNMGYSGLLRTLRKYNTNDYWLLSHLEAGLPYETSLYVAKITAAAIIANNPDKFGFGELGREATVNLARVEVAPGTPLKQIASAAGMSLDELRAVNPHFKKTRVAPGASDVNVYVPKANYTRFAERWTRSKDSLQHVSYVVRFGETFEEVARRYDISPAKLRDLNELAEHERVGAGFPLIVPAAKPGRKIVDEPAVATVPARVFQYEGRRRLFYRVGGDDTPVSLARFFGVTVDELNAWNPLSDGHALQKGMLLQLFVRKDLDVGRALVLTPNEVRILTLGSEEFYDFHETQRGRVRVRYRVQAGDTMKKLAQKFELSAGSIGRINQFSTKKELKPDDLILMYVPEKQLAELTRKGLVERIAAAPTSDAADGAHDDDVADEALEAQPEASQESSEDAKDVDAQDAGNDELIGADESDAGVSLPPPVRAQDLAPRPTLTK
jgi:membrane-bound lytic murein transglycosylase D